MTKSMSLALVSLLTLSAETTTRGGGGYAR